MKCTARDVIRRDGLHLPLKRNQFDGLRERSLVDKIVVGLAVDPEFDNWMSFSANALLMHGSAYWMATKDIGDSTAQAPTIVLPNRFNVDELLDMLQRIADGGAP